MVLDRGGTRLVSDRTMAIFGLTPASESETLRHPVRTGAVEGEILVCRVWISPSISTARASCHALVSSLRERLRGGQEFVGGTV